MHIWLQRILDKSTPLHTHAGAAGFWNSCAVSEVDATVPNVVVKFYAEPADKQLKALGMKFHTVVSRNQRAAALRCYLAIQKRVAHLAGVRA